MDAPRQHTIFIGLIALVMTLVVGTGVAVADDDLENFDYAAWDVTYDIGLDTQGRARAAVTESLDVQFPEVDQNRGIIRSLPLRYQSAPAAPENIAVTDADGQPVPFEVEDEDGFRNILVGDDTFVHGAQSYVISYTVDDVMHATDTADEFYWDLVPVDRQQDIAGVTAEIMMDERLTAALTGHQACYRGTPDDSVDCALHSTATAAGSDAEFTVDEASLAAGHGLTVVIGVQPGTVTQPPERHENFLLDVVPLLLVGAALLLAGGGAVAVARMIRRHRDDTSDANIAYGIPQDLNPLLARWLLGQTQAPIVAMILDFAVRGVLRIEERDEQLAERDEQSRGKKDTTRPQLRLLEPDGVDDPLERDLLRGLFPALRPGETFAFPERSKAFTEATQQVVKDSGKAVIDRGYQLTRRHRGAAVAGWSALLVLVPMVVLLVLGASRDNTLTTVLGVTVGLLTCALVIVSVVKHRVLTPRGAGLRRQLQQLRAVFTASHTERLAMLQSYTTAPRRPTAESEPTGDDAADVIQLYDRLLPYAVLFGKQRDWTAVLAEAYQRHHLHAPIWYPALLQHGATGVQDSLTTMLSSVSAAAAGSSPAAGSTGGGAAGGGGGGGAAGGR